MGKIYTNIMTWQELLTISHIIGTVLGVGGSTFADLIYRQANRDDLIDPTEAGYLRLSYRVLRIGLFLLIFSGFGFFLLLRLNDHTFVLYLPNLWMKLALTVVLLVNAVLMQVRRMPMWLGAAISLVAWYSALMLGVWRTLDLTFPQLVLAYVIIVGIVAAVFRRTDQPKPSRP